MPFFGTGESTYDSSQNVLLTSLNQRLSTVEAYNAGNRLSVLEALNSASRLSVLEALNAGARLTALEAVPTPTLTSLGGETAGAATAAIASHKAEATPHSQITSLESRATALEARPLQEYPISITHFYGYAARAYNGFQEKSFSYTVSSTSEFGRYASIASPTQNDVYEVSFLLKSGSYNLTFLFDRGTTRGIASVYFNDSLLGTIDAYSSSTIVVNRTSFSIFATYSGVHTIKMKMLSKNASSTGYVFNGTGIFISPIQAQTAIRFRTGYMQTNNYTDSLGNIWTPDIYYTGGDSWDIEANLGQGITIQNTNDQPIYKFERSKEPGNFSYSIPITSGTYNLKLHFCENIKTASGQRIGTVALNGSNILTNFDIFADAGGQRKALIKSFNNLSLTAFTLSITNTLINGIELLKL